MYVYKVYSVTISQISNPFAFKCLISHAHCRSEAYAGKQQQTTKKHDLSKWKFPELRDTINTSCGKLACVTGVTI